MLATKTGIMQRVDGNKEDAKRRIKEAKAEIKLDFGKRIDEAKAEGTNGIATEIMNKEKSQRISSDALTILYWGRSWASFCGTHWQRSRTSS